MRFTVATLATIVLPAILAAQAQQGAALRPEQQLAHDIYKELVEINTADSVGSTTVAANAVAKRFRDAGFPDSDIYLGGPRPEKWNIVVRYHGKGARRPLLLLAHLDVVQALKKDWSPDLDPFTFTERDGYYYGRGTGDDKAMASIFVANLLRYKREGYVPDRDLVLALTADEEGGGSNGVRWLLANHKELIDAAYALNEGGGGALRDGKPFINAVGAAEKVSANFTVSTANRGGHSSVPRDDNAIYQLAQALTHVATLQMPVMLNEVTKAYFTRTADIETPEMGAAMRAIVAVLLATILSFAVARTIAQPLAAITDVMREVASTGDLTRKIALAERNRSRDLLHRHFPRRRNSRDDAPPVFQRHADGRAGVGRHVQRARNSSSGADRFRRL